MAYGNFSLTLPTIGQAAWGGDLNTALQTIADQLDTLIGVDALDIQASLDMQGHALVDVESLGLEEGAAPSSGAGLWVSGGELRFRDGNGNDLQISLNGAINITGTGGIGGDYVADNSGGVTYSTANLRFTFIVPGGNAATIDCGDIRQGQGADTDRVTLKCPTSLANSYSLVWPQTLPSARSVVEVDSTGSLAHTENIRVSGVIGAGTPSVLTLNGRVAVSGTAIMAGQALMQVTGTLWRYAGTVNASAVEARGILLQSGSWAHVNRTRYHDIAAGQANGAAWSPANDCWSIASSGSWVDFGITSLDAGDRIKQIVAEVDATATNLMAVSLNIRKGNGGSHEILAEKSAVLTGGPDTITLNSSPTIGTLPALVPSTASLFIRIRGAHANDEINTLYILFDRPEA